MRCKYFLIFFFIFFLSTPASGGQIGEVAFPDRLPHGQSDLILNGLAMRTFAFFDVYAAGLYLATPSKDAQAVLRADTPRIMTMHFLRGVQAKQIAQAWQEGLDANAPSADASLKDRFAQLATMMEPMDRGDALDCVYEPGAGTTIRVKGVVKGIIPGKDFSDALLACWIGPKPGPGEKFRAGILGQP